MLTPAGFAGAVLAEAFYARLVAGGRPAKCLTRFSNEIDGITSPRQRCFSGRCLTVYAKNIAWRTCRLSA